MKTAVHNGGDYERGIAESVDAEDFSQLSIKMDIIAAIAHRAALEVDGIFAVDGGISGGIATVLKRDISASGIKVALEDNSLVISVNIIAQYGMRIPEIAWNLQERVKRVVEDQVGIKVLKVNVTITGVKECSS